MVSCLIGGGSQAAGGVDALQEVPGARALRGVEELFGPTATSEPKAEPQEKPEEPAPTEKEETKEAAPAQKK